MEKANKKENLETEMNEKMRLATDNDKDQVIGILNYYIEHSMAAYPLAPLPVQAWEHLKGLCREGNLWVLESEAGTVIGFAMLKWFMGKDSFVHTADVGYFIKPEYTGMGLGRKILVKLEEEARKLQISVLVANVSSLNPESLEFHKRTGFTQCGKIPGVGKKQGQLFDIVWFYKNL